MDCVNLNLKILSKLAWFRYLAMDACTVWTGPPNLRAKGAETASRLKQMLDLQRDLEVRRALLIQCNG